MARITQLNGVGEKRARALEGAGIFSVADLLDRFPRDYDDRSQVKTVAQLMPECVNTIRGVVAFGPENAVVKRFTITRVKIVDETGMLEIVWFNQPYLKKYFKKGGEYIFTGKVREAFGREYQLQMQSPDYEPCGGAELSGGRIVPIYTPPKMYSQKTFRALIFQALGLSPDIDENLPAPLLEKYGLISRDTAVRNIHFPEDNEMFLRARRRLVFEELFLMQLSLLNIKNMVKAREGYVLDSADISPFLRALPFELTGAQAAAVAEIANDMQSGVCMNRLVQGDVGSGKTAVAFAAAYMVLAGGFQAAMMVPTDVLANQHFSQCEALFAPFGFTVVLLTGSLDAKTRRENQSMIADGRAQMIIGTHALIQKAVEYHNLALCITDEQHRFGVNQRMTLSEKSGNHAHTLVMTATPIPRTLGLILYGDLDISVINEKPPGRQEIKTYSVTSAYRERINGFIKKETGAGRQVYIICPSIEESDAKSELQNVIDYTRKLSAALPSLKIEYLHGKIKPAEKQAIMDDFKAGKADVLVSTTVIEVGVHVANATLMIIENAERFGLSQLHQLRGRVGRGTDVSYCVLITDSKNPQTSARIKAMTQTNDGFALAEMDLEQRGYGDFFGTRQHGLPSFAIANLYRDMDILKEVQDAVKREEYQNLPALDKHVIF